MKIKGLEKLSEEQKIVMRETNELHIKAMGLDPKDIQILETWIDENNCVCVRLSDGDWYHYTNDNTWY